MEHLWAPEDRGQATRRAAASRILAGLAALALVAAATLAARPARAGVEVTGDPRAAPPAPPATYYGQVLPAAGFTPAVGMAVVAAIDGKTCGQSATFADQGQIVYSVDVVGEGPGGIDGCGAAGRTVVFSVAGRAMAPVAPWDNTQVHPLPLQPMQPPLPPHLSIARSGESLLLSWPAVAADTGGKATLVLSYQLWRGSKPDFTPGSPGCGCMKIADVNALSFTDSGIGGADVVGDPNNNYTYLAKAVNAAGESAAGNRAGEFDFTLTRGAP